MIDNYISTVFSGKYFDGWICAKCDAILYG
nr:MAG TPA: E3 ubiquitin-protein ligase [Caudoviricetes sp.]